MELDLAATAAACRREMDKPDDYADVDPDDIAMMKAIERMPVNPDYTSLSAQLSKCSVIELNPEEGDNQAAIAASNGIWRRVVAANEAKAKAKAAAASKSTASNPAASAAASKSAIKYAAASAAAAAAASSCKEKTEPIKQEQRPQPAFNATAASSFCYKHAYAPLFGAGNAATHVSLCFFTRLCILCLKFRSVWGKERSVWM